LNHCRWLIQIKGEFLVLKHLIVVL
jgi:hypothetical protein